MIERSVVLGMGTNQQGASRDLGELVARYAEVCRTLSKRVWYGYAVTFGLAKQFCL